MQVNNSKTMGVKQSCYKHKTQPFFKLQTSVTDQLAVQAWFREWQWSVQDPRDWRASKAVWMKVWSPHALKAVMTLEVFGDLRWETMGVFWGGGGYKWQHIEVKLNIQIVESFLARFTVFKYRHVNGSSKFRKEIVKKNVKNELLKKVEKLVALNSWIMYFKQPLLGICDNVICSAIFSVVTHTEM